MVQPGYSPHLGASYHHSLVLNPAVDPNEIVSTEKELATPKASVREHPGGCLASFHISNSVLNTQPGQLVE